MEKSMMKFIKKLYFNRECCTEGERRGAKVICQQCEAIGVSPRLEEFSMNKYKRVKAGVYCKELGLKIKAEIANGSQNTSLGGVEKEFVYLSCLEDAESKELTDKICLVASRAISAKFCQILLDKKVAGLILAQGSIYDKKNKLDPHLFFTYKINYTFPVVSISMKDAQRLAKAKPKKISVVNVQESYVGKGNNIVVDIEGQSKGKDMVVFTAHYDTTKYSKGAYDNGAGCAILFELIMHFKANQPKMNLRFIFFSGEEAGMNGSAYYCAQHKDEMKNIKLCINVDMLGTALGTDYIYAISNEDLLAVLKEECQKAGFFAQVQDTIYSSDNISFSRYGVPSISFAKRPVVGGAVIHTKKDTLAVVSPKALCEEFDIIRRIADLVANKKISFKRQFSDKMKEDVKNFFK